MKSSFNAFVSLLVMFLILTTGQLAIAANTGGTDKTGLSEPLKACYKDCAAKNKKDNELYEACMIECKKTDRRRSEGLKLQTK